MNVRFKLIFLLLLTLEGIKAQEYPFYNSDFPTTARITDLLSRLSPEEKVSQLLYNSPAIDRLGIPEYNWWNECLHGVGRAGRATVFPQAIGLAATFDDSLVFRIADAISTEARAKHNLAVQKNNRAQYTGLTFWTPNINIFRDPRWGRGQETYGEDPYLTGRMGAAFVKGLQGNDPKYLKAAACAKHFAVHSGPEKTRHEFNAVPSEKDLRETYLPAFKTLVDADVEAVMCAYNRLYEIPCCGSTFLLKEILREEWGFDGHIVSDCWALDDIWQRHKTVATKEEAAAMAALAGVNLNCGYIYKYLGDVIWQKRDVIWQNPSLDSLLKPLLATRFRLGMFDPPAAVPWSGLGEESIHNDNHRALAREAAAKSIVLLKNENRALPLKPDSIESILVAGPTAADILALTGNYNGWSGDMVTLLEGIVDAVDGGTKVDYAMGCRLNEPGHYNGFWEAQAADAIILCLGNTRMLEGEDGDAMLNGNGGDRIDLRLPESQREYSRLLREQVPGKPIIAVVTGGSAIALQEILEIADAVLFAWYPGEQGGSALADILFGKVNPSGKLPVTFYKSIEDLPPFDDYSMENRTYKFFRGEPLFPFGYGLSYTSFDYQDLKTDKEEYEASENIRTGIYLKNTGKVPGEEVVMVYAAKAEKPEEKHLVGFKKVNLRPGETASVVIEINLMDMYQWDEVNHTYHTNTGNYMLIINDSDGDMELRTLIKIR
jgi:beta-glucosidase